MTNTTTDKVSPQDALAAAENVYKSTQAAADAALAAASRQALDDAEAAAAQAIADAVTGEGDRATADAARERVEKLRRDHEWAQVELQAAETGDEPRLRRHGARSPRSSRRGDPRGAPDAQRPKSTRLNQLLDADARTVGGSSSR